MNIPRLKVKEYPSYEEFLSHKRQSDTYDGFDTLYLPDFLFDFQKSLVEWAIKKGRAAIFADCGLGKTPMQLVWAENVVRKENKPLLIISPLAVAQQTVREAEKFGIECKRSYKGEVSAKIVTTNYERLHLFNPNDFCGAVCDESSAIKNFDGERKKVITSFMRKLKYRLLCTATAAPNDYIELGTSSEALGYLGYMDMLGMFFRNDEDSLHPMWHGSKWRLKAHGENDFWRWVCSWARALRKPSDFGFDDGKFLLPKLDIREHTVINNAPLDGELFIVNARTLEEQRRERKVTIKERCEMAAELSSSHKASVLWCHLNEEGDLLEEITPDAIQISGSDSDEKKEEIFLAFTDGQIPRIITKPRIGGFGMNWQHCAHTTFFPSHSYEQYYQAVRRFWRFGQKKKVTVDIVTSEGEQRVLRNLQRKADAADEMFSQLVFHMKNELNINRTNHSTNSLTLPTWLSSTKN